MALADMQSILQDSRGALLLLQGLMGCRVWPGPWVPQELPSSAKSWVLAEPFQVCWECCLGLVKSKTLELLETRHPSWKLSFVVHVFIAGCLAQGVQGAWAAPAAWQCLALWEGCSAPTFQEVMPRDSGKALSRPRALGAVWVGAEDAE